MNLLPVEISKTEIANFCQRHRIAKLSIFGSVLREDFSPESDIDFLVEFQPQTKVSYLDIAGMEEELTAIVGRT
ncbi:MAG: nucleotidyltransferase, partial [Leptolyngbya sp. SIO4C5]|nr:nucleotidyltransferase [Leptolyngbya sp. SIO4C5]